LKQPGNRLSFYFFILWALFLSCLKAQGQGACFTFVGDSVGCAPFTVTVKSCAQSSAIISFNFKYTVDWVDTDYVTLPLNQTEISYTYTQPGTYIIDQARGLNENLKRTVRVFNKTDTPIFDWSTCEDTLRLTFKDLIFSSYTFDPGDGSTPFVISDRSKPFKYKYNFTGEVATYPFSIQGKQPETCNKTLMKDTVTLYKTNQPPLADSLIGIDTVTYRSKIQIRADEPFGFQLLDNSNWVSTGQGISNKDNSAKEDSHVLPSVQQKSRFRAVTQSGCGNVVSAPEWTLVWVKTQSDKVINSLLLKEIWM
jgi:hypothetical protein